MLGRPLSFGKAYFKGLCQLWGGYIPYMKHMEPISDIIYDDRTVPCVTTNLTKSKTRLMLESSTFISHKIMYIIYLGKPTSMNQEKTVVGCEHVEPNRTNHDMYGKVKSIKIFQTYIIIFYCNASSWNKNNKHPQNKILTRSPLFQRTTPSLGFSRPIHKYVCNIHLQIRKYI